MPPTMSFDLYPPHIAEGNRVQCSEGRLGQRLWRQVRELEEGPRTWFPGRLGRSRVLSHPGTLGFSVKVCPEHFLNYPPQKGPGTYLPADRIQGFNGLPHILVHVESINDRIYLEGHSVISTPRPQFLKIFHMVLLSLTTADEDIDLFIEAVTGDGEDVQILT